MKKLLMIVGMMLAAALVPVWAAEQVAGSDRPAPEGVVSFTLAADKTVFVAKDPLEFKLTVTNVSRQAYTFTTGRAHYYWKYHIKAADRDAEYEVYCAGKFEAEPAPFRARLAPGEAAVQAIKLGDMFRFRPRSGVPSDTGKRNESLESARLPAGRYAMTVEFDYRLVSEETVASKATLGPVAFTIAGDPETGSQRKDGKEAEQPKATGQPAAGKFVVHEWGVHIRSVVPVLYETPTLIPRSMGGLEMKVVDDPSAKPRSVLAPPGQLVLDLPDFVLRHANEYHPRFHTGAWDKPVLHFYGREGAEVTVQVFAPQGRPLAYWPKPKMVEKDGYRQDLHGYGGLVGPELLGLSWTGRLTAKPAGPSKPVPPGHWWQTVREVPSLWFDTGDVSERFIFYEATALQEPAVLGKVADDALTLTNRDANATGPVLVIVNDGQTRRFVSVADIGANQAVTLSRKEIEAADGDAAKLLAACRAQWEAFGMTREEARAIVETWKPDLLEKTGFLVISRMPATAYDAMFPLKITPAPDQVVRAGVVFDTLPGEESRLAWLPGVQAQLRKIAEDLAHGDPAARVAAGKQLLARGELAGGLAAQLAKSDDPESRAAAAEFQRATRAERVVMPAFLKQPQADR